MDISWNYTVTLVSQGKSFGLNLPPTTVEFSVELSYMYFP